METEITSRELKEIIETAYITADEIEKTPLGQIVRQTKLNGALRDLLKLDLIRFVSFLASIKGHISDREAYFLRYYFDMPSGPREVQAMRDPRFAGTNYADEIPTTLTIYMLIDKHASKIGLNLNNRFNLSASYIMLCTLLGQKFLKYNGSPDVDEFNAWKRFVDKLNNARAERLEGIATQRNNGDTPLPVTDKVADVESKEETLDALLKQLDELIGMEQVKKNVYSLINLMRIREIKKQRGLPQNDMSLHMVFMGNPGTGKTTVARLIAKIYQKLGVLSKGHLVEVDRSGLVAGYVGQTAIKVQEKISESRGGVLFIDEAYALTANRDGSDFGFEAVDTLLKGMEDYRDDFVVIVAGYPEPMAEFLESNPGLKSRFNKFIYFDDYTPDELLDIFRGMCKKAGFIVSEDTLQIVHDYFIGMYENRGTNFANGRDVRNFFEKAVVHQANRLAQYDTLSDADLITLNEVDLRNSMAE